MPWQSGSGARSSQTMMPTECIHWDLLEHTNSHELIGLMTLCGPASYDTTTIWQRKKGVLIILYLLYIIVPIKCSCFASVVYYTLHGHLQASEAYYHQGRHRRTWNKYRTCIIIIINYWQVRRSNLLILSINIHLTNYFIICRKQNFIFHLITFYITRF